MSVAASAPAPEKQANPMVYAYLSVIAVLFMSPGTVVNTPLQFIYKNELHLQADQTAIFKLIINGPGLVAFLWGICRDRYNPLRMGDRGFMLVFGAAGGLVFLAMAFAPLTVYTLGACLILWGIALGLVGAAYQAIMRNLAEKRQMSGRMSTAYNLLSSAVPALMLIVGGWATDHMSWRVLLVAIGLSYFLLAAAGFWRPAEVFDDLPSGGHRSFAEMGREAKQLLRHRGYWVAVAIWAVWAFSPAGPTPLMYFLTNTLKMNGTQYSLFNSIYNIAFFPTVLLFGLLCKRFSLWSLLLWATVIGIPQWMPLVFIHSIPQAFAISALIGLVGGLGNAAYYTVLLRACPEGLAATGMLIAASAALWVVEGGNVLGGFIYKSWGFAGCGIVTTAAYALLLPLCFLLPRALVRPHDEQVVPQE